MLGAYLNILGGVWFRPLQNSKDRTKGSLRAPVPAKGWCPSMFDIYIYFFKDFTFWPFFAILAGK